jgi:hypothetical protein
MILVHEKYLLSNAGKPHSNSAVGLKSLNDAVSSMVKNDRLHDVLTEASHIVGESIELGRENLDEYVTDLRENILTDQFDIVEKVVSKKCAENALKEDTAELLKSHICRDLLTCYLNIQCGERLRIWKDILEIYLKGFFPCGVYVPPTEQEWFDEALIERCKILVF